MCGGNQFIIHSPGIDNIIRGLKSKQTAVSNEINKPVFIKTFGHFDVFIKGNAVLFNNPKAKELLAILVDRNGGFVSAAEAIECLWEDRSADKLMLAKYRKTALQLN